MGTLFLCQCLLPDQLKFHQFKIPISNENSTFIYSVWLGTLLTSCKSEQQSPEQNDSVAATQTQSFVKTAAVEQDSQLATIKSMGVVISKTEGKPCV